MVYQYDPGLSDVAEKQVNDYLSVIQKVIVQGVILSGVTHIYFVEEEDLLTVKFEPCAEFNFQLSEFYLQISLSLDKTILTFTLKPKG